MVNEYYIFDINFLMYVCVGVGVQPVAYGARGTAPPIFLYQKPLKYDITSEFKYLKETSYCVEMV